MDEAGVLHKIPRIDGSRLAEIFAREVLGFLVRKELLSPEWAERILSWRHTGFNVHSLVRTKTKPEAERLGKYMIRPVLSLERLSFLEQVGKVGYRWGRDGAEQEAMNYLEFIARVTSHIPDKGQVMVRYYGLCANVHIHRSPEADVCGFSWLLTAPRGRPYTSIIVRRVDFLSEAGIHHIVEKGNSYIYPGISSGMLREPSPTLPTVLGNTGHRVE